MSRTENVCRTGCAELKRSQTLQSPLVRVYVASRVCAREAALGKNEEGDALSKCFQERAQYAYKNSLRLR
jgi:hypothetical protein